LSENSLASLKLKYSQQAFSGIIATLPKGETNEMQKKDSLALNL
jgi:hypothetical protein